MIESEGMDRKEVRDEFGRKVDDRLNEARMKVRDTMEMMSLVCSGM